MRHYSIQVFGKVQGVFFRASTVEKCLDLGLKGWVRNQEDNSVKIEVQGAEEKLEKLVDWIEAGGPRFATIAKVRVEVDEELKPYRDFKIMH